MSLNAKTLIISMIIGGRGEIRTHEGAKPPAGFQDRCLKPLGHPSTININYLANRLNPKLAIC
jgi:hypothetical protein